MGNIFEEYPHTLYLRVRIRTVTKTFLKVNVEAWRVIQVRVRDVHKLLFGVDLIVDKFGKNLVDSITRLVDYDQRNQLGDDVTSIMIIGWLC